MKRYILFAVAGILALSACSNIDDNQDTPRQMTFRAGFSSRLLTKATLNDHSVSFNADDDISILSANNTNEKFTTETGGASATFKGTATAGDPTYYAIYPFTYGLTLNSSTGVVSGIVIPNDQTDAASSACGWDQTAPIAYATTTGSDLAFHNACALLKITNNCGIASDIWILVNELGLTGVYDLNTATGALTVQEGLGGDRLDVSQVPNNKTIYLAIAPGTYTDFMVFSDYAIKTKASVTFQAGKIYDLGNMADW